MVGDTRRVPTERDYLNPARNGFNASGAMRGLMQVLYEKRS
jgi:hypothetical protein